MNAGGTMDILLQTPSAADAAALSAMAGQSFTETFGHLYDPADLAEFLKERAGAAGFAVRIADPHHAIRYVAEEGRIIAYVGLGPLKLPVDQPEAGAVELQQLYVLKPWQGSGIAHALMDWAIAYARGLKAPSIYLSVFSENARAMRFYTRYGFSEVGRYGFQVGSQIDDDRIWRRAL